MLLACLDSCLSNAPGLLVKPQSTCSRGPIHLKYIHLRSPTFIQLNRSHKKSSNYTRGVLKAQSPVSRPEGRGSFAAAKARKDEASRGNIAFGIE